MLEGLFSLCTRLTSYTLLIASTCLHSRVCHCLACTRARIFLQHQECPGSLWTPVCREEETRSLNDGKDAGIGKSSFRIHMASCTPPNPRPLWQSFGVPMSLLFLVSAPNGNLATGGSGRELNLPVGHSFDMRFKGVNTEITAMKYSHYLQLFPRTLVKAEPEIEV